MYIKRVRIKNIRSLSELDWEISPDQAAGWHVIIGDNGAGKSSFVRSVALALVGPAEAQALLDDWNDWLQRGQSAASIKLDLIRDLDYDHFSGSGRTTKSKIAAALRFDRRADDAKKVDLAKESIGSDPTRHVWGDGKGWFSAAYGPFRRFYGGDQEYERVFFSKPKLARHLSVFDEGIALKESLEWLQELHYKELEGRSGSFLASVKEFINQEGFLPFQVRLENISSDGIEFIDGNGCQIWIEDLSDGYRSILSMTLELVRQLANCYEPERIFANDARNVRVPGVVLIDEIDAHLHPTWQRRVGLWFRQHFPYMQFIVTTHSPLVCQAADVGTIWRLPDPGSSASGRMIMGKELDRLLYGNVLDAYSTEAFGSNITRSDESKKRLQRLAELNSKELHGQLTEQEKSEQEELRSTLPTAAHTVSKEAVA